ncbi:hypothetical protein [Pseudomonas phage vB_PseuGesM_254]|uniref:Virion structural protein n=1 Tax=Pseudomonas phage vB_PseuGesM_254 TaxID=3092638 RepID=A0AAX4G6D9_9CAUD|nr:hypothetical protein [Pseudomonas phage PseuGes_254]
MPYNGDPTNNPVDRVRLIVGDIWADIEILSDADYQYFLDKNDGNVNRAAMDAARTMLFKLSRYARERTGDIEVYGSDWFKQFAKALDDMIKNPNLSISLAVPYAGGISKRDMRDNDADCDNVTRSIYIGFAATRKLYDQQNPEDFSPDSPGSTYMADHFLGRGSCGFP